MQDKDDQPDEDNCVNFNLYMSDYSEAALAAGTSAPTNNENEVADDNAELLRIMQVTLVSLFLGQWRCVGEDGIVHGMASGEARRVL
jgi:hypothetical protein